MIEIHDVDWRDAVLAPRPEVDLVVVEVFTPDCAPCQALAPVLAGAEKGLAHARFYKLDATQASRVVQTYNIQAVPTILIFKDGQCIKQAISPKPKELMKLLSYYA